MAARAGATETRPKMGTEQPVPQSDQNCRRISGTRDFIVDGGGEMPTPPSSDNRRAESGWRRLVALCSLPGIFAAPLALLHQLPGGTCDEIHVFLADRAFLVWTIAAPFEAAGGAALVMHVAARFAGLTRSRSAIDIAQDSRRASGIATLFPSLLPMTLTALRVFAPIWTAAAAGGALMAAFLPVPPLEPQAPPNPIALLARALFVGTPVSLHGVGDVALAMVKSAGLGLYGAFVLTGLPLLLFRRLRNSQTVPMPVFVLWVLSGVAVGWWLLGPPLCNTISIRDYYLLGLGGSVFCRSVYFALGSGAAAHVTSSLLSRQAARATPPDR